VGKLSNMCPTDDVESYIDADDVESYIDGLDEAQALAAAVARLYRRLRQERQDALTASQLSLLSTIRWNGPCSARDAALIERVSPPIISRILARLIEQGLVDKRPDPTNGRQVLLSATQAGVELLDIENTRRDAWLGEAIAALSDNERKHIIASTKLLLALARAS
jgi:DNA-binding MarR family transcriptional regulator